MNIVYLVHETAWKDLSGTPILTQQYADLAIKNGHKVCIITPSFNGKNEIFKKKDIFYLNVDAIVNWSLNAFKKNNDIVKENLQLPFKPDIIHIIDWVHINPNFINDLRKYNVPILRHVNSFEELCYFQHPIYQHNDNSLCQPPLKAEDCTRCITKKLYKDAKLLRKVKYFLLNEKKKDFNNFYNSLKDRNELVLKQFTNIYDHLIFGSSAFAEFFFSHIKLKKNFSIIPHGVDKKKIIKKNFFDRKINIIYTGGRAHRKGWKIVEKAFDYLLNKHSDKINLRIYGHKKKIEKSNIGKHSSVECFDFFEYEKLEETISWADIAVLPTLFEPYGIIIREFLSLGVSTITTNTFGPSEIIKDKINGIILTKPYINNLKTEIENLIQNKVALLKYHDEASKTFISTKEEEFNIIMKLYDNYCNTQNLRN